MPIIGTNNLFFLSLTISLFLIAYVQFFFCVLHTNKSFNICVDCKVYQLYLYSMNQFGMAHKLLALICFSFFVSILIAILIDLTLFDFLSFCVCFIFIHSLHGNENDRIVRACAGPDNRIFI